MASQRRGPWSNAEDAYLMQLVHTHGPLNWVRIAQTLGSRTPKQCRERYHQNLKPTLNHDPITPEEGLEIERLVLEIGKRWAEIARRLNGRSDNAVKNWWNGSQNRRRRLDRRRVVGDDDYPRSAGLSIPASPLSSMPRLPPPPPAVGAPYHHGPPLEHRGSWGLEAPLPSPCSSESAAESDSASNYTTSPANSSLPLRNHVPVELPPLRTGSYSDHGAAQLPSLSSLTSPAQGRPRVGRDQLPTAPNSPVQQHAHRQAHHHQHGQQGGGQQSERDSRMNLAALLR